MVKLHYTGNGAYIMGIPAHDLSDYDVENIAFERGISVDELISMLTGRGLYVEDEQYICEDCGKEYVNPAAFHKHVLAHLKDVEQSEPEAELPPAEAEEEPVEETPNEEEAS